MMAGPLGPRYLAFAMQIWRFTSDRFLQLPVIGLILWTKNMKDDEAFVTAHAPSMRGLPGSLARAV